MKSLMESLLDDDLIDKTDKMIKDEIKSFLKENYDGLIKISKKPNADGKYEVSSTKNIRIKNYNMTSLTNGMFIWTTVDGFFDVIYCNSLKSLEGAPKEVGKGFRCSNCNSLKSLEGAPEKVGWGFYCHSCNSLKSLEGAPKEVGRNFYCYDCAGKFTIEDVKKISNVKKDIIC